MTAPVISAVEWAWQRQSVWSQTANKLKAGPSRARTAQLVLTVAAAALALAGSQLKGTSFVASLALGIVAAVALAGVGLGGGRHHRRRSGDGVRRLAAL